MEAKVLQRFPDVTTCTYLLSWQTGQTWAASISLKVKDSHVKIHCNFNLSHSAILEGAAHRHNIVAPMLHHWH